MSRTAMISSVLGRKLKQHGYHLTDDELADVTGEVALADGLTRSEVALICGVLGDAKKMWIQKFDAESAQSERCDRALAAFERTLEGE